MAELLISDPAGELAARLAETERRLDALTDAVKGLTGIVEGLVNLNG